MNRKIDIALLDICRTCLRKFSGRQTKDSSNKMQSIFEVPIGCQKNTSIMEILQIVHPEIKVKITDKFPMSMCTDCIQKLLVSYEFIEMYKNSYKNFCKFLEKEELSDCELNEIEFREKSFYNDDIYGINKYALEIDELNTIGMEKVKNTNYECPVLKNVLIEGISDIKTYFTNPYSDDSDEEWIPKKCRKTKNSTKITIKPNGNYNERSDSSISNFDHPETIDNIMERENDIDEINISNIGHTANPYHEKIPTANKTENRDDSEKITTNIENNEISNSKNDTDHSVSSVEKKTVDLNNTSKTKEKNDTDPSVSNVEKETVDLNNISLTKEKNDTDPSVLNVEKETVDLNKLPSSSTRKQPARESKTICRKSFISRNDSISTNSDNNEESNSDSNISTAIRTKEKYDTESSISTIENELSISQIRKEPEGQKSVIPKSKKINENGKISCKECEMVLDNVELWKEHVRKHKLENKCIKCEHCGKRFATKAYYRLHLRIHTGETPYLCFECGKGFTLLSSYNTHLLRHKGVKNYQCPQCPIKFMTSSGLYSHRMVHTKERKFVCDICGSAFHMAAHLRKHKLNHNDVKDFQCDRCDKSFTLAQKLRRHMLSHTGEKPYRCAYCEKAFAQCNDHRKHLRLHLGNNIYMCKLCPQRFPMARDLREHLISHKDDDEETRERNLKACLEAEKNLEIKYDIK